ncbi:MULTISPECIES: response regulator [Citrifermentans]|uniref:Response receiver CheY associated with MCPs of class 34H n=1 Tax=Citrifermentans bemidjiense (strain ATCC BAA-1014 / DSM 16622 / JCM 12645 / Bem) TaxID=404380 RepID=B5EAU5_CITBB|nr:MULTISPECIES: response regulator [Citrifermentans]ACH37404.1 response receiver CheY associated with MCPs of class 34H [Citrifermentans bemidjiense Bem]
MNCLIVEDNEFSREALRLFLAPHAEIELAADGQEGVELFQNALARGNRFDLVLLDVVMPKLDGQQALKLMRQAEKDYAVTEKQKAVIIMTTALTSAEQMQQALWDGDCTDYLVKPIVRADLLALLRRYRLLV